MNESGNSLMTFVSGDSITRRAMLLSLPGLAFTSRLIAQHQVAPLSIVGLQQITLAVSDIERSLAFYQELFGVSVQARHEKSVLLRLGTGPHFLALMEAGPAAPRIDHFGMAVESFDPDRVVETLEGHGITRGGSGEGLSGGPLRTRVMTRGDTPEIYLGDPNGLIIQLQDPKYCGGSGPLGDNCAALEPAPGSGSLELIGLSHLTINVSDPESTNAFYQATFGMDVQAFQAASPLMGVGQGSDFLMFISLGRTGRGSTLPARIDHACLTVENFDVLRIQNALEEHGIRPRGTGPNRSGALRHWVSMRMPNRGGAPEGTPELYFSDPDGLSIQLQDIRYCGGGGYLGESC
jgi:catechol 2,3-dioxygenase-like lactoylglutathione lyase family enzyme